jgi:hypothetical protein
VAICREISFFSPSGDLVTGNKVPGIGAKGIGNRKHHVPRSYQ